MLASSVWRSSWRLSGALARYGMTGERPLLEESLDEQREAIQSGKPGDFHALDNTFHKLICELGGSPLAVETIGECKQKVDRLCRLSLGREREASTLLDDHERLARALADQDAETATATAREHLARLDAVIVEVRDNHTAYFE